MKILVTGGAGYIGSIAVKYLIQKKHEVIVVDNLSKGKKELLPPNIKFYQLDCAKEEIETLFKDHEEKPFDAVIHFAGYKAVEESMENAPKYSDNIKGITNVLNCMVKYKVKKIVFSSSAAVYGEPKYVPIDENHPTNPVSYYGYTKLCAENIIDWYSKIHQIKFVCLRYFNVAGDELNYQDPEAKNVFPILAENLTGKRKEFTIYGNKYKTNDGTCVRDYIDVRDLIDAHVLALNWENGIYNLGSGKGYSVNELVKGFEQSSKMKINCKLGANRKGDPAIIIASTTKAKKMGWLPKRKLQEMIDSSLKAYLK
jgi:UDP-glucose 4-epimerase